MVDGARCTIRVLNDGHMIPDSLDSQMLGWSSPVARPSDVAFPPGRESLMPTMSRHGSCSSQPAILRSRPRRPGAVVVSVVSSVTALSGVAVINWHPLASIKLHRCRPSRKNEVRQNSFKRCSRLEFLAAMQYASDLFKLDSVSATPPLSVNNSI